MSYEVEQISVPGTSINTRNPTREFLLRWPAQQTPPAGPVGAVTPASEVDSAAHTHAGATCPRVRSERCVRACVDSHRFGNLCGRR